MTPTATLALIITLSSVDGYIEQTVATLPADTCLAAMRQIWAIPAETVDYDEFGAVPALDAACVDPATIDRP